MLKLIFLKGTKRIGWAWISQVQSSEEESWLVAGSRSPASLGPLNHLKRNQVPPWWLRSMHGIWVAARQLWCDSFYRRYAMAWSRWGPGHSGRLFYPEGVWPPEHDHNGRRRGGLSNSRRSPRQRVRDGTTGCGRHRRGRPGQPYAEALSHSEKGTAHRRLPGQSVWSNPLNVNSDWEPSVGIHF